MSRNVNSIPDVCPICNEELNLREAVVARIIAGEVQSIQCPSCHYKLDLPKDDAEKIAEVMKSEKDKAPPDYTGAVRGEDPPGEDAMAEYKTP
jgi:hypothetical protein